MSRDDSPDSGVNIESLFADRNVSIVNISQLDPQTETEELVEVMREAAHDFEQVFGGVATATVENGNVYVGVIHPHNIDEETMADILTRFSDLIPPIESEAEPSEGMVTHNHDVKLPALYGIGKTRAGKLVENGIETCQDMAASSPERVAEILDVSDETAESFIKDAKVTIGYFE